MIGAGERLSRGAWGRGWVLFEMMVALTIFIFMAVAVLGAVNQGLMSAERTRDASKAADLARSTMAKLEAGLGTVQNLAGPVPAWEPTLDADSGADVPFDESAPSGFSEEPPVDSLWEVEIETLPSEFPGLTHVTVTAVRRVSELSERVAASYTLHQLVRLAPETEDSVGELDDIGASVAPPGGRP